jgi:hypothetical protein
MLKGGAIISVPALAILAASSSFAASTDSSAAGNFLNLRVGPGISATFATGTMSASCSDNAVCSFAIPSNSKFDIIAEARPGRNFRWTGCSSQSRPATCRVEVRKNPVSVTVR